MAAAEEDTVCAGFDWEDHAKGALYGNGIGDAIGLLAEFMTKGEAKKHYGEIENLEYEHKLEDMHRKRWAVGDWTDDTDQMILIMLQLLDKKGQVDHLDYAQRLVFWMRRGFPELGDHVGMGIGDTTDAVVHHPKYKEDPHEAARAVWEKKERQVAPNGGVMRTSVLGIHCYKNIDKVIENTLAICKVSHADPRCQASCVAVTTAIAMMLQRADKHVKKDGSYNDKAIRQDAYDLAKAHLPEKKMHAELKRHMFVDKLSSIHLDEPGKIGFTYKTLGAGFWAFMQDDFRKALTKVLMHGGDADTNSAVAGALLGCKLGAKALPESWLNGLKHKAWFEEIMEKFFVMTKETSED